MVKPSLYILRFDNFIKFLLRFGWYLLSKSKIYLQSKLMSYFYYTNFYSLLCTIGFNYFQSLYLMCKYFSHNFLNTHQKLFFSPISYRILRTELQNIRRKGALRTCGSLDRPNIESNQSCSRCRIELGKVINRGATCRCCRLRICKNCREFFNYSTDWVCIVCHKQMWVSWIVFFFLCYKNELRYYINVSFSFLLS